MSDHDATPHHGSFVISDDRARAVEEAGRRAGAALRSPAPTHGATEIHGRAHRRRVVRIAAATAAVGVLVAAGVIALSIGDESSEEQPVDSLTTPTGPPIRTRLNVVETGTVLGDAARYGADGSLFVVNDGHVLVYDPNTLARLRELPCPTRLERLPESLGTAASEDWVWDAEAAAQWDDDTISIFQSAWPRLCGVMVSADGSRALSSADVAGDAPPDGGERRQLLWDTSDGSLVAVIAGVWPAFSTDGSRLVTGDTTSITLRDTSTGAVVSTISDFPGGTALNTATSPDGSRLLRWRLADGRGTGVGATIYDLQTLTAVGSLATGSRDDALAQGEAVFDATAGRLATLDAAGVTIWDASTGTELRNIPIELALNNNTLAASPDGATLAVAHGDHITVLDSSSGALLADLALVPGAFCDWVVFSSDGGSLAARVAGERPDEFTIRVWSLTTP